MLQHIAINYPPSAKRMVHPFSPERSISACFSCAFHAHAGVFHSKISNFKILIQMASIWQSITKEPAQNAAPFWRERGTASQKLAGDSWFLYVWIRESRRMLNISFIKIFRILLVSRISNLSFRRKACWCSPSEVWKEAPPASGLTSERKLFKFPVWWFFRIPL